MKLSALPQRAARGVATRVTRASPAGVGFKGMTPCRQPPRFVAVRAEEDKKETIDPEVVAEGDNSIEMRRRKLRARRASVSTPEGEVKAPQEMQRASTSASTMTMDKDDSFSFDEFMRSELPGKLASILGLIAFTRLGVYIHLPGIDIDAFQESIASNGGGLLGYLDSLSGGSISRVGLFSLGIIPYINSSILLQLLSAAFPSLKKLQREEGPQGRARFQTYQKLAACGFAAVQAVGALALVRPFVTDYSAEWVASSALMLTAGAMILVQVAETISEYKLGNGTSLLIFTNIASALPTSIGAAIQQSEGASNTSLSLYALSFLITTLGIVYVQEAERKIPMQYASRSKVSDGLQQQAYLPFKVNATGVMPVIFSTSLLSVPYQLARSTNIEALNTFANAVSPSGALYVPLNVSLIVFFNYYYTFLQFEPTDLAEQLKKQGASIPAVRPGKATADYVTSTLTRMSVLGSAFLGILAAAPSVVEQFTGLTAFRGFAGTSVLILVGVATDVARRTRAEQAMAKYGDIDKLYEELAADRKVY